MKKVLIFLLAFSALKVESVKVDCEFWFHPYHGYECKVKSLVISTQSNREVTEVSGAHKSAKVNADVKSFEVEKQTVKFFPQLSKIFSGLEIVKVLNSSLSEVKNSDLKQFGGKLKDLQLPENQIEILQGNLFEFNPNLEWISFSNNKLRQIDDGVFNGLTKLKTLHLRKNPCIDEAARNDRNEVLKVTKSAEKKCKTATAAKGA